MRKGALSDKMQLMKHTELRRPPSNIAHSVHSISLDKTIFHGIKPLRGVSHIKSTGSAKYDMNNLSLITPIDYRGGLDAYAKEVQAKKHHTPIADKKIEEKIAEKSRIKAGVQVNFSSSCALF